MRTAAEGTFKVSEQSVSYETGKPTVRELLNIGGIVDLVHHRSDTKSVGDGVEPGDTDPADSAAWDSEEIWIGSDLWTTSGTQPGQLVEGPGCLLMAAKPWTHFRRPSGNAAPSYDPTSLLDQLHARGAPHITGHEPIMGVPTARYTETFPTPVTGAIRIGPTTLDVWIDHHGLIRQLRTTTTLDAQPHADPPQPAQTTVTTIQFFDFGVAVTVQPPPASQTDQGGQAAGCEPPAVTQVVRPGGGLVAVSLRPWVGIGLVAVLAGCSRDEGAQVEASGSWTSSAPSSAVVATTVATTTTSGAPTSTPS
jgi:hypothetical protein